MLNAFDVMLYSLILTRLMSVFRMDQATAGLFNALTLAASAVGTLLFGSLADRFGRRRMLNYSIITYSVFTFASGLVSSVAMLALLSSGCEAHSRFLRYSSGYRGMGKMEDGRRASPARREEPSSLSA
jgi:MFS family permease